MRYFVVSVINNIYQKRINLRWHPEIRRLQATSTLTSVTCSQCLESFRQSEDRVTQVSIVTYKYCIELVKVILYGSFEIKFMTTVIMQELIAFR